MWWVTRDLYSVMKRHFYNTSIISLILRFQGNKNIQMKMTQEEMSWKTLVFYWWKEHSWTLASIWFGHIKLHCKTNTGKILKSQCLAQRTTDISVPLLEIISHCSDTSNHKGTPWTLNSHYIYQPQYVLQILTCNKTLKYVYFYITKMQNLKPLTHST